MPKINFRYFLCFCLLLLITIAPPAQSQQSSNTKVRFIQPPLQREPENRGAPSERQGAGSRGSEECPALGNKSGITALVPLVQRTATQKQQRNTPSTNSKYVLSLTVADTPTFWFYFPYAAKDISSIKFVLLDEQNNPVTKQPIPINLSATPGVISFTLTNMDKPMEIGKYYHWFLLVDCNPQSRSADTVVEGLVQRIEMNVNLKRRIQAATARDRVAIYANAGIWQEAITILGQLRRSQPQNPTLAADWKDLLSSVELQNIAAEPITPCCSR